MRRTLLALSLLAVLLAPAAAEAARNRPLRPTHVGGDQGVRAFLGLTGDLWDDRGRFGPLGGSKFAFGADLILGPGTGLAPVAGLRMGAGPSGFTLEPIVEAHYRFELPVPLVPYVGGGAGLKLGFDSDDFGLALGFRLTLGAEYFVTDTVSFGAQLTIPDVGPRLLPTVIGLGNVEFVVGSQVRF